jgi:putative serine protease PepD
LVTWSHTNNYRIEELQMVRKHVTALIAAAAVAVGAGAGVGGYAAVAGGQHTASTTTTQSSSATAKSVAAESLTVGQIYKQASTGVVEITTTSTAAANTTPFPFGGGGGQGTSSAQGSGFVYDSAGHIVTNDHVVAGADSITVTFADGSKYKATVVGSDASTDLAVLKVDAPQSKLHPLTLGDSAALAVGDGVVAIGSPFGLNETVTSGIVSALNRTISSQNSYSISGAIQTDAAINPGNSGGPLLNTLGDVIGVNSQIESQSGGNDGVGFAIPSNTIRSVVSQIIGGGQVAHAYLGVSVGAPSNSSGALIGTVQSGSPASAAGLKVGDVITAFGGAAIATPDALTSAVNAKTPGEKVSVQYVRAGVTKTATVTLGSRAA